MTNTQRLIDAVENILKWHDPNHMRPLRDALAALKSEPSAVGTCVLKISDGLEACTLVSSDALIDDGTYRAVITKEGDNAE